MEIWEVYLLLVSEIIRRTERGWALWVEDIAVLGYGAVIPSLVHYAALP